MAFTLGWPGALVARPATVACPRCGAPVPVERVERNGRGQTFYPHPNPSGEGTIWCLDGVVEEQQ